VRTCTAHSKENVLGERGKIPTPANDHSSMITPMQSDDSGQIVMRKVSVKKRPQWQVAHTILLLHLKVSHH